MTAPTGAAQPLPCAGDLSPAEAWALLQKDPTAVLVDVRTRIELALIGGPDLSPLAREPVRVEWMTQQGRNPEFTPQLKEALQARGVAPEAPVLFLCRSGARSRMAAGELTAEGFRACFNIAEGFEGDLDANGHRNSVGGWKVRGLPWKQT